PAAGDEWAQIRAQFELAPDWIHLGGFLLASHPKPVRDAIERHRRALDSNPPLYLEEHMDPRPVLEPITKYMGVKPDEIALTDSTTMGLGVLYSGLPLKAGDEVVTTLHDHYVTYEALRWASERSGATLKKVALYDKPELATAGAMTDAIKKAISPATRLVAIT